MRRARLIGRLSEGLNRRLTLVVAGPGFGKTVALADFAHSTVLPVAWLQIDPADGDLVRFVWHLVQAIGQVVPGGLPGVQELLSSSAYYPLQNPEAVVATLVGDLVRQDIEGLVICVDDWHLVPAGSGTMGLMHRLVPYLPDHVHLYLAGRSRGDLPVERWQVAGWLDEVTLADLRFDAAEAETLFRQVYGVTLAGAAVQEAIRQTEGWAPGMYLLGRSLRGMGTLPALPSGLPMAPGDAAALEAYLEAEVMAHLPADRQAFLQDTAVLDDPSASLCDRLRGASGAAAQLAALAADGLLTYRVDPARAVYRYHPLFREYLLRRLSRESGAGAAEGLHRRAADLLTADGDRFGAMQHLLAARDGEAAARLLEEIGESARWGQSAATVAQWLGHLPPGLVDTRPRLLLLTAEIDQWNGQLEVAAARLERAERLFRLQGDQAGLSEARARLGHIYLLRGEQAEARRLMLAALAEAPPGVVSVRARCLVRLALVEWMDGAPDRCEPLLKEALGLFRSLGDRFGEAWALHNLAIDVHVARGELQAAVAAFHQVTDLCAGTTSRLHCICLLNLGSNLAYLGRYAEGRGYLQRALEMATALDFSAGRGYALAYLGRLEAETGDVGAAAAHLEEARAIEAQVTEPQLRLEALGAEILLHRRQGNLEQALETARQHLVWAHDTRNPFYLSTSWYNLVLIHVGRGAEADAQRALARAQELLASSPGHYTRFLVRVAETVMAMALPGAAPAGPSAPLAEAMALAAERGYEGLFLAEGVWGLRLLKVAVRAGLARDFAGRLAQRLQQVQVPDAAAPAEEPAAGTVPPRLRICLLGQFTAELDGRPVPQSAWRGRKPQELVKLLALRLGSPAGVESCLDSLWPQLNREAQKNFRVTLYWIRRALGEEPVQYREGYCALDPARTWCDVAELRQLAEAAGGRWRSGDTAGAIMLYKQCAELYRGDLLAHDPPSDWHLPHREELREICLTALSRLAVARARAGELEQAIADSRRMIALDPLREPAYRLLMRLLIRSNRRGEAARLYRICEESLRQELGVRPSAATRLLYDQLVATPG